MADLMEQTDMAEVTPLRWQWAPDLEGRYKVWESGDVESIFRRYAGGRILKPRLTKYHDGTPYRVVRLYRGDGTFRDWLVSRLVLETFDGPCPYGLEVRHLDGDSLNNARSNLVWGDHSENMLDKIVHGTDRNAAKARCRNGHEFTPDNTLYGTNPNGRIKRYCKRCKAERMARYRAA